jgi:hypothetical protein
MRADADRELFVKVADLDDLSRKFAENQWRGPVSAGQKQRFSDVLKQLRGWREADRKAESESGYPAVAKACDVAHEVESAARKRLMQTPAPSQREALWKLEQLFGERVLAEEGNDYCPAWDLDFCRQFFTDVQRLLQASQA